MERKTKAARFAAAWLAVCALCLPLLLGSCGDDYERPSTTQTPTALIDAATLKAWMDAGKVNGTGSDRVVILDIGTQAAYNTGHIPGAYLLIRTDLDQTRSDGIAAATTMVPEGPRIDALIKKYGIDGNTTIVITGTPSVSFGPISLTRVYFVFRYWGFPKSRIKLLDGGNVAWTAAGNSLTTEVPPSPAPSSYSVRDNRVLRDDLRLSLSEMLAYVDKGGDPNMVLIDPRGPDDGFAGTRGKTGGVFNITPHTNGDFMVFEGRMRGAKSYYYMDMMDSGTRQFHPAETLVGIFTGLGLDSTKTAYIYCRIGLQASAAFFALDGILGWPVSFYEGSWSQWGQLSGNAAMKGQLNANSPWRTDIPSRSELIAYNFSTVSNALFTGEGLNDLTPAGSSAADYKFVVEIDGTGTPDTFRWSKDNGATWDASSVAIDGGAQTLIESVTVTFGATTGHTAGDSWIFTTGPIKAVEQFTMDGSVCSARYNTDGTITNSSGGITACSGIDLPNSFDVSGNLIEEADKSYMSSGGGGGTGGGSTIPGGC